MRLAAVVATLALVALSSASSEPSCRVETMPSWNDLRVKYYDLCEFTRISTCSNTENYCSIIRPFDVDHCYVEDEKTGSCTFKHFSGVSDTDDNELVFLYFQDVFVKSGGSYITFKCDESATRGHVSSIEDTSYNADSVYVTLHVKEVCPGELKDGGINPAYAFYAAVLFLCVLPPLCVCLIVLVVGVAGFAGCTGCCALCCTSLTRRGATDASTARGTRGAGTANSAQEPLLQHAFPAVGTAPAVQQLRGANGLQLFKGPEGTVYILLDNQLRSLPDMNAFDRIFGIPNDPSFMNSIMGGYAIGAPLPPYFGVVKCTGRSGIYFIVDSRSDPQKQVRRLVASAEEFNAFRLAMDKVDTLEPAQFDAIPEDSEIRF